MKKTLAMAAAALLLLGLTGCGKSEIKETQPPIQTEAPAVTEGSLNLSPQAPQETKPLKMPVIVRFQKKTQVLPSEEEPLLEIRGNFPTVWMAENPEAQEKINGALMEEQQRFLSGSFSGQTSEELAGEAGERKKMDAENFQPSFLDYSARVTRGDGSILSLSRQVSAFAGGPYAPIMEEGLVFDSRTGERLQLDDLSGRPEEFREFLLDQMVQQAQDPDLQLQIAWFGPNQYREKFPELFEDGRWLLDPEGLFLFSEEEQFGPHAAGSAQFRVEYEKLHGWLKEEYLPSEPQGSPAMSLEDPVGCNARIVDDLTLESGQILLLKAEGRAENVELVTAWFADEYMEGEPIWYGSFLEDGVIRLETSLPDAAPNLMLKYRDGAGEHRYLLAQSGKDGSLFLMEP